MSAAAAVAAQQHQAAAALQALQAQQQLLHQEGNFQPVRNKFRPVVSSLLDRNPLYCVTLVVWHYFLLTSFCIIQQKRQKIIKNRRLHLTMSSSMIPAQLPRVDFHPTSYFRPAGYGGHAAGPHATSDANRRRCLPSPAGGPPRPALRRPAAAGGTTGAAPPPTAAGRAPAARDAAGAAAPVALLHRQPAHHVDLGVAKPA